MKMIEIKNVSGTKISIRQVRNLAFEPGETKKVHPATVTHPAVSRYIGKGLELVEPTKEEPTAPAPSIPVVKKAKATVKKSVKKVSLPEPKPEPLAPVAEPTPEPETKTSAADEETAGTNLREKYLLAPGVTNANVDALLEACPTLEQIVEMSRDELSDLGVSITYIKRLKSWAQLQLSE